LAKTSKIGQYVRRVKVLVEPEGDKHGQSAAAAGKTHRFARDAMAVKS
jgi:hypothetical protein